MEAIVDSVTVCLVTSDVIAGRTTLRVDIPPTEENSLRQMSQIQVEKLMTFPRDKVRGPIGQLEPVQMQAVDTGLLVHLGLATQLGISTER